MEAGDALYEEEEEAPPGYDFEPLPALLEDEENVSLADILSLRDSCLTEQDIWAICLECSHSLKSVAHSAIFQTLCITPDTLAFNTNGNVCFMEQLSDDPEGAFVPPEFDITGNTFEAHIYSLGTTLKAAIEYVIEPGTESDFGKDLQTLLEQMQEENPEDRPDIESIISLCEEKLKLASSCNICRSLSAIGRRVLSIESFGASQDGCDNMWKGKVYQRSLGSKLYSDEKNSIAGDSYTVEDVTASCCRNASIENVSDQEDGSKVIHLDLNNEKSQHSKTATQVKKSKEDDNHTLEFSYATSETPNTPGTLKSPDQSAAGAKTDNYMALEDCTETSQGSNQNYLSHFNKMDSVLATNPSGNGYGSSLISSPVISNGMMSANNNEDNLCGGSVSEIKSNEQWLSLKLLLSWHGKPLKDYELWALCHECLLALQTCTDYPACLCLDSVLIDCHGNILFAPPKDEGSYDTFYLAPEIDEEDIVTEKVCIYGTAAVLWMAAKCSFPPDHKLALPRKLKNLLLDMAKKNPEERPSLADAIKTSSSYLCERGINSKKVLALLSKSVFKAFKEEVNSFQEFVPFELKNKRNRMDTSESFLGFVPITRESKLIAVKGPVPCQISLNSETTTLPVAFTSSATHFKPIILQQNTDITKETPASTSEELEKEVKEEMQIDTNKSVFVDEVLSLQNKTENTLLQKAVHLIQEEFAFDGYLENGAEVFAMGNYILTLKDLKFEIFCDAISEKFCDLYWDEKLLENLYKAVHGKTTPPLSTTETDYSKCGHMFQHLKTDSFLASSRQTKGKEKQVAFDTEIVTVTNISPAEMDLDELSPDNFEKEPKLKKVILKIGTEGECLQSNGHSLSPDLAEENIEQEEETTIKAAENTYPIPPNLTDFNSWNPGWSSAFYGAECYNSEVYNYVKKLGKQKVNDSQNIEAKKVELEQLLMIETKNYRKTIQFYQKLLQKERRNKDSEIKTKLLKLKGELQEMKSKVQFLETVKKYLQIMCAEQWGMESCDLTTVINIRRTEMMDVTPLNEESLLIFYNMQKNQYNNQNQSRILQAGTPLGLMAYLYSRNAILEGYVQQFLYTFRYFCTQEEFLQFLLDRISSTLSSAYLDPSSPLTKIYNRSCYILRAWIADCYRIDFATNTNLLCKLKDFITSKITPLNSYGECLLSLLEDATGKKHGNAFSCYNMDKCKGEEDDDRKSLHSLCKKLSEDVSRKSFNWKLSKGNGPAVRHQRERPYTISSALPKPCYNSFTEEFSSTYAKAYDRGLYLLAEYSAQQLCCQLTLLQQEMFHKCHPVHFLNSRALGVKDKCVSVQKVVSTESVSHNIYNLFLANCIQDKYLLQLLRNSDNISTWVAAEIVTCHTSKLQMNLLSKFLLIAKSCYEQRNFATAMQILVGLENLMVRQLPAWKILPSKISEIMEELKAVEVFLKSDSLCLMEGERFKTLPTIPSARVLAMHVQQLETGGFIMANGSQKWTKLRNIAKVVSQVHAFQENPYTFTSDLKLQAYLRKRIDHFSDADISTLAADNCANFHQIPADKHSRKIQDTLRRMKATFQ
ncbi:protein very KIND [Alligator mississippiensis]|uniref:Kinase non-catalytic C-lobe domain-containing protein 1 n=1 Tax=Alligator mississippiensis TaxID=8496 RepID=A0A151NZS8_ALLMI|nr:protein very KIND [Alligator mississippiensis]